MAPTTRRVILIALSVLMTASTALIAGGRREANRPTPLILATTTSTENSGLLSALLPPFEARYNATVRVIAVGTGQALEIGRSGDADVLMVHAPSLEEQFVQEGYGVKRVHFMYNDFVLLGPEQDQARISGAGSAVDAMKRIAESNSVFISRGDNSGTHVKEQEVWTAAGVKPEGSWYREVGQGMGAVITLANDQQAYTLADRSTYLSYIGDIDIGVLFEGDEILFNPYGIIAVNSERHPHVRVELARALIDYIVSEEGQRVIANYTVAGRQLFFPDAR